MYIPYHVSHVTCHMPHDTCYVSYFFSDKIVDIVSVTEGYFINRATPSSLCNTLFFCRQREEIDQIRSAPDIFPPADIQNIKHLSFINILLWWYSLSNHICIIPQYFHKDCIIDFKFISKVESQTNIFFEKFSSCSFYMNIFQKPIRSLIYMPNHSGKKTWRLIHG